MKFKELFFGKEYTTDAKPKKIWFVPKKHGWGFTPSTWQGWTATVIFISIVVINAFRIDDVSQSVSDVLLTFVPQTLFLMLLFVGFCMEHSER